MGSGEKVLLVKFDGRNCRARVVIPAPNGSFVLDIASANGLDPALREQQFRVVVADVRAHTGDMMPLIKKLRKHQAKARLLVLSDKIELESVVGAMRLGVADIFQEPVDFDAVHDGARGGVPQPEHLRRSDIADFFVTSDAVGEDGAAPVARSPGSDAEISRLETELEQRNNEVEVLRSELETAHAAVKNLENEVAKYSVDSDASQALELEHGTITRQLESLRKEKEQWAKTEQSRAALEKKVAELEAILTKERAAAASLEKARTAAEHDLKSWHEKQGELEAEHALGAQQCKALEKELAQSKQVADQAQTELAKLRTGTTELEKKLAAETKTRSELATTLKAAQEALAKKDAESGEQTAALQKELEAEKARVAALSEEVGRLENLAVAAEVQLTAEASETEKLRADLNRERDALDAAKKTFANERTAREEQLSKRELEIVGRERAHHEAVAQIAEKRKALAAEQKVAAGAADEGRKILDQAEKVRSQVEDEKKALGKQRAELEAERKAVAEQEAGCRDLEKKLAAEEKRLMSEFAAVNNDRMSLEEDRAAFEKESATLAEQMQAFEKKREEMKRLLAAQ